MLYCSHNPPFQHPAKKRSLLQNIFFDFNVRSHYQFYNNHLAKIKKYIYIFNKKNQANTKRRKEKNLTDFFKEGFGVGGL